LGTTRIRVKRIRLSKGIITTKREERITIHKIQTETTITAKITIQITVKI
jgi:hypothetical protein